MAAKPKTLAQRLRFTPWAAPARPPTGLYDPALDAQERAAGRGYSDLQQDTDRDRQRLSSNYAIQRGRAERDYGRGVEDIDFAQGGRTISHGRTLADLLLSRTRGTEDYTRATADVGRRFGQLGRQQTNAASVQGVSRGGTLAASMAARGANRGREQEGLDITHRRQGEDIDRGTSRENEDYGRDIGRFGTLRTRLNQDVYDPELGQLAELQTNYAYGGNDLTSALARAGREQTQFGQDVSEQRFFQAAQGGYSFPDRPSNEFTAPNGTVYRTIKTAAGTIRVDAQGRRVDKNGRRI
jgi:hypothetical protein